MRRLAYLFGLLGLIALLLLALRSGAGATAAALAAGGIALLWMLPLHAVALLLDAIGWRTLLRALSQATPLRQLFAIATVREAINRLLPVANIGGEVIGIRLLRAAGVDTATAAASIIVEVLMTLVSQYLFAALGVACLLQLHGRGAWTGELLWVLATALLGALGLALLLRRGDLFARLARGIQAAIGVRAQRAALGLGAELDHATRALCRRPTILALTVGWQLAGLAGAALENYWLLRLLAVPVPFGAAVALESLAQLIRHFIFIVPAGVGIQEAGLVALGAWFGVPAPTAIALSLIKRGREILFGVPPLLTWQWYEARRLGLIGGRA